jgi:argininosuccinate synthase
MFRKKGGATTVFTIKAKGMTIKGMAKLRGRFENRLSSQQPEFMILTPSCNWKSARHGIFALRAIATRF